MEYLKLAWEWRYSRAILPIIFLSCFVGVLYAPLPVDINISIIQRLIFGSIIASLTTFLLWRYQLPEKTKKGSIGIIIAIRSEDEKTKKRISTDFIETCKTLLAQSTIQTPFQIIELNEYHSKFVLDNISAEKLRRQCDAHFLLFGSTSQRKERGKNFYSLKFQGLVCHAPISNDDSSVLAQEMKAVLPLKAAILEDDELSGFEITTLQLAESTKYVIATAALLSHDTLLAITLLEEIIQNKNRLNSINIKAAKHLIALTPKRLAAAYRIMSIVCFTRWESTRETVDFEESLKWLEMFSSLTNDENIDIYLVRAIGHFVLNRDTVSAMKCINRCKSLSIANTSWKYSAAFLEAYRKNIDSAMQYYDAAFPGESKHETPFQIENFIAWVLELEPDKQQLHFCLGYINEQYKNDMISALEHYRVFIDSTPCEETSILAVKHAKNFINNSTI